LSEIITSEIARSGHPVLKKSGRWLASSFDPVREARQWADAVVSGPGKTDVIIVLGLGCGYHVAELIARRPERSVLTIECDPVVRDHALRFCPELRNQTIIVENEWMKLIEKPAMRDVLVGVYRVAVHAPSLALEPNFFASVDNLLRGRDRLSFLLLLKTRPELLAILDPDRLGEIGELKTDEAVSIKTMQRLFSQRSMSSRERRLWRVLEELVL